MAGISFRSSQPAPPRIAMERIVGVCVFMTAPFRSTTASRILFPQGRMEKVTTLHFLVRIEEPQVSLVEKSR